MLNIPLTVRMRRLTTAHTQVVLVVAGILAVVSGMAGVALVAPECDLPALASDVAQYKGPLPEYFQLRAEEAVGELAAD